MQGEWTNNNWRLTPQFSSCENYFRSWFMSWKFVVLQYPRARERERSCIYMYMYIILLLKHISIIFPQIFCLFPSRCRDNHSNWRSPPYSSRQTRHQLHRPLESEHTKWIPTVLPRTLMIMEASPSLHSPRWAGPGFKPPILVEAVWEIILFTQFLHKIHAVMLVWKKKKYRNWGAFQR